MIAASSEVFYKTVFLKIHPDGPQQWMWSTNCEHKAWGPSASTKSAALDNDAKGKGIFKLTVWQCMTTNQQCLSDYDKKERFTWKCLHFTAFVRADFKYRSQICSLHGVSEVGKIDGLHDICVCFVLRSSQWKRLIFFRLDTRTLHVQYAQPGNVDFCCATSQRKSSLGAAGK